MRLTTLWDQIQPSKMVNAHADGSGMYGSHRMAVRNQPDIRYIEFPCPQGQATALASFYRCVMNCIVHTQSQTDDDSSNAVVTVPSVLEPSTILYGSKDGGNTVASRVTLSRFLSNRVKEDPEYQDLQNILLALERPNLPGSINV